MMKKQFESMIQDLGLKLSTKQWEQFEEYHRLLVEWNSKMNLTAITEKNEVFVKHFYDSLCVIKGVELSNQTLLDVGSGAGFPSIPLKIMFPSIKITIIDALQKRITFLTHLTESLGIEATLIHGRAEEFQLKNAFDIVTARAVANLRVLSELCIPFVKVGGLFIALKGPKHIEETNESSNAIMELGGKLEQVITYEIDQDKRSLILVHKISKTQKKYPRQFSKIKKSPL